MVNYIFKRVLLMVPTLLGVALLIFFMLRVLPGDIIELKLRGDGGTASAAVVEQERERLGLNQPLPVQFGRWIKGMATLDMGLSLWTNRPVVEEIGIRIGLTLQVSLMAAVIAALIAIPLGTISALYRDTWIDYLLRIFTIAGLAVPSFWLAMMIILMLLSVFSWAPPVTYTSFFVDPIANLSQLIWPALAVGYRYAAVVARLVRSSIIEVMREDYIRTARAKGLFEKTVIIRHAMGNALLPAITVFALEFAFLIGGLVVTEQVFNLNGIGRLFVDAVAHNDYTLIQAIVMLIAVMFIVVNLLVDVLYGVLDPRILYR
jgi:peptide/nickel transport system permease protein